MGLKEPLTALRVEKMAFGARGIARLDGKTIFVPGAVPFDEVLAHVEDKGSFGEGVIQEFLKKSPLRGVSPCPYSEDCGGCQWSDISSEMQNEWKWQFVQDSLQRIGKIPVPEDSSFVNAEDRLFYRNRVLLRGTVLKDGTITAGFFKKASRVQIAVGQCAISDKALNQVIESLQNLKINCSPQTFRLELQYFPAFSETQEACVTALVHPVSPRGRELDALVDALQAMPSITFAGSTLDKNKRPVLALEKWEGRTYYSSPGLFFQVHLAQNRLLRSLVRDAVSGSEKKDRILDLFCGSGNLALMLADGVSEVTGVESHPGSVRVADYAARANGLEKIRFYVKDSEKFLRSQVEKGVSYDVVISDPPRAGMKGCIPHLKKLAPETIICISCDPATLARDLGQLREDYELKTLRALDFFPQTYHVESFAVLKKRKQGLRKSTS